MRLVDEDGYLSEAAVERTKEIGRKRMHEALLRSLEREEHLCENPWDREKSSQGKIRIDARHPLEKLKESPLGGILFFVFWLLLFGGLPIAMTEFFDPLSRLAGKFLATSTFTIAGLLLYIFAGIFSSGGANSNSGECFRDDGSL